MNLKSILIISFMFVSFFSILYSQESEPENMNKCRIHKTNTDKSNILVKSLNQITFPEKYFDDCMLEMIDEEYRNNFYDSIDYKRLTYLSKKNNFRISIIIVLYPTSKQALEGLQSAIMTRNRMYNGPNFNIGEYMISADSGIFIFSRANVIVDIYADSGISMLSVGEDIDQKILEIIK